MKHLQLTITIKKIFIGVIAMAVLNLSTSCGVAKKDVPSLVERMLQEKYGEEFVVTEIGNRYNTGSVTLYCHPSNNESINFTATYKNSTEELTDDFVDRKYAVQLDHEFSNLLKDNGFNGTSLTIFYGSRLDNVQGDETINEFISNSNTKKLYTYLVMDAVCISNNDDAQKLLDTILKLSEMYNSVDVLLATFFIPSTEYEECRQKLQTMVSVNGEWFDDYNVISDMNISITDKSVNSTADDIIKALKG